MSEASTLVATHSFPVDLLPEVRCVQLEQVGGEIRYRTTGPTTAIGSHQGADLVIDDPSVSRFHCELSAEPDGVRVRDTDSTNGTLVDGLRVVDAFVRDGAVLTLGNVQVRVRFIEATVPVRASEAFRFGRMVGRSFAMRAAFAVLETAARSDSSVLIQGETGTGKELAAEGIHIHSSRAEGPFVVVDCASLPDHLVESELFGHVAGAFTGAIADRVGAFEAADGGTLFLDELGELPPDLQPKLLRALQERTIKRVGGTESVPVDVRVVGATHRDLRREVNAGRFRSDLFYRLAVITVTLPPLRVRPEDLPLLIETIAHDLTTDPGQLARVSSASFLARARRSGWPGNVRELRNAIERTLLLGVELGTASAKELAFPVDTAVKFPLARQAVLDAFELAYIRRLLERTGHNVSEAARLAGVHRTQLYRLMRRHGLS